MKLDMNDIWPRSYKAAQWMLNICINYAKQGHKTQWKLFQLGGCLLKLKQSKAKHNPPPALS